MDAEWAQKRIAWLEKENARLVNEIQSQNTENCTDSSEDNDDGELAPFGWTPGKCMYVHNRGNAGLEYWLQEHQALDTAK